MQTSRIQFFLLINFIFLSGCASQYKGLVKTQGNVNDILQYKPRFTTAVYIAGVDIIGKHLSGLLVIKTMPDSSLRMVFSSEMGLNFFDFEFSKEDSFIVHRIMEKMDRKAVIKTLRNDFELAFMRRLDVSGAKIFKKNDKLYYTFYDRERVRYYITDEKNKLISAEAGNGKKAVVRASMTGYKNNVPDSIGISHQNFNFNISLKRMTH